MLTLEEDLVSSRVLGGELAEVERLALDDEPEVFEGVVLGYFLGAEHGEVWVATG